MTLLIAPSRHTPLPIHSRNPRRAYDVDGFEITPMTFQQAMDKGVHAVWVICDCGHVEETPIYVGAWPSTSFVPDAGMTLRCSACAKPDPQTVPAWPAAPDQPALDLAANSQTGGPQVCPGSVR
ncbi:hypothetical protein [Methylobacterium oryzae]|uniref:hypothetical protein n=1 Tax=Methylobacterium oryzae TaxID=334852 RepID=UPI002F2F04BE